MFRQEATELYLQSMKAGQREKKACLAAQKAAYPAVLDDILDNHATDTLQDLGIMEIPIHRIAGTKSQGRIHAFSPGFSPLLSEDSEFAQKWISLCADHLEGDGIRNSIDCYEYLGLFYVEEGNKRVSVLKSLGAPRISAHVKRILPKNDGTPRLRAYYEFLDFYKVAGIYDIQFRRPGDYSALISALGKEPDEVWNDRERKTFFARFQYFCDAFYALDGNALDLLPEEALLLWLKVYPFPQLSSLSAGELKKTLLDLWPNVKVLAQPKPIEVRTEAEETQVHPGIWERIVTGTPSRLQVAFIHPMDPQSSTWVLGHYKGSQYLQDALGEQVRVCNYFHADTPQLAEEILDQVVSEGANLVFTTSPQLSRLTLKAAVRYPKVRFLNCSVDTPYSSIRTYYSRIYEAKFITGALAGAVTANDRIGYIGANPIFGEPASINAFALGAQLTNPRARVTLRWSCLEGSPQAELLRSGIRVISNRDVPMLSQTYLDFCTYGTYTFDDKGKATPLASPCCLWGTFYERVARSVLSGSWDKEKASPKALNYWWGMDSGVIDVTLSDRLPAGLTMLAQHLRESLKNGTLDPFRRPILSQDGTIKNDGSRSFSPEELLRMDWLCENVDGTFPQYDQILSVARPIIRALGINRDQLPPEKEEIL